MDGEVPNGWAKVSLGQIAEIRIGGTPARARPEFWARHGEAGHKWLAISDMKGRLIAQTAERITDAGVQNSNVKLLPAGTLVMSFKLSVGRTGVLAEPMYTNEAIAGFITRDGHDSGFLRHYLEHYNFSEAADRAVKGVTLNKGKLAGLAVMLPPPEEQRCIARVLDAIDEAIEKTEAVIAATEQVRKALLQELLTRGVPGWHTEWKTVPGIGTIPACWKVVRLGDCGAWLSGGTPSKDRSDYWSGAVPWISPKDMKRRELFDAIDHVTEAGARAGSRIVEPGTILLVVRGMILAHSFPVAIARVRCAFNQDIKALVCHSDISPDFLLAVLESRKAELLHLPTPSTHGTMRVITEELQSLMVPKPAPKEQGRIAELVAAVDLRIATEQCQLEVLKRIKDLLADALLSGRVRVPLVEEVTA